MTVLDPAPPDEVTGPWWEATRDHRLTLQHCAACDGRQHPPRAVCTTCGRTDALDWIGTTGAGVVDAFTVVHRGPSPDADVPYVVARVRLEEGPLLLTRLDGPVDAWAVGDPVGLAWHDLTDGRALPVFQHAAAQTPAGRTGSPDERQDRGLPAR